MQSWRPVAVGVAVRVLVQLHIPRPVPLLLNAPPLPDQAQQRFLNCAQAGKKQMACGPALGTPSKLCSFRRRPLSGCRSITWWSSY